MLSSIKDHFIEGIMIYLILIITPCINIRVFFQKA